MHALTAAALLPFTWSCANPAPRLESRPESKPVLRVSADPNNLPFSNDRLEGFENKIAQLIADELGVTLQYDWRAQRRGFFRHALKEGECDVVLAVPKGFDMALTTAPYYRSTYAFVTRLDRNLDVRSFDDPLLKTLKIGVQLIGDDGANTPPAHALARRGIVNNLVGYTVYGDYTQANPPAAIIGAVVRGEVDVAVVWGPLAGYFARNHAVPLHVVPVSPDVDRQEADSPGLPLAFSISLGVRKDDKSLRDRLDAALIARRAEIERILDEYGVPRVSVARPEGAPHP